MIADRCFISLHTVETHRRHLLEKFGAKNSMDWLNRLLKYTGFNYGYRVPLRDACYKIKKEFDFNKNAPSF